MVMKKNKLASFLIGVAGLGIITFAVGIQRGFILLPGESSEDNVVQPPTNILRAIGESNGVVLTASISPSNAGSLEEYSYTWTISNTEVLSYVQLSPLSIKLYATEPFYSTENVSVVCDQNTEAHASSTIYFDVSSLALSSDLKMAKNNPSSGYYSQSYWNGGDTVIDLNLATTSVLIFSGDYDLESSSVVGSAVSIVSSLQSFSIGYEYIQIVFDGSYFEYDEQYENFPSTLYIKEAGLTSVSFNFINTNFTCPGKNMIVYSETWNFNLFNGVSSISLDQSEIIF